MQGESRPAPPSQVFSRGGIVPELQVKEDGHANISWRVKGGWPALVVAGAPPVCKLWLVWLARLPA